ncbi:hypothetical protein WDU94_013176 [Cyamophila willieti]
MSLLSKSKKKNSSKPRENKTLAKKATRSRSKSGSLAKASNKTKNIKGLMDKITFKIKKPLQPEDGVVQTSADNVEEVEKEPGEIKVLTESKENKMETTDNTNIVSETNTTHALDKVENVDHANIVIANNIMNSTDTNEEITIDTSTLDENMNTTDIENIEDNSLPHVINSFTKNLDNDTVMRLEHELVGPGLYRVIEGASMGDEEFNITDVTEDLKKNTDNQEDVTGTEVNVKEDYILPQLAMFNTGRRFGGDLKMKSFPFQHKTNCL